MIDLRLTKKELELLKTVLIFEEELENRINRATSVPYPLPEIEMEGFNLTTRPLRWLIYSEGKGRFPYQLFIEEKQGRFLYLRPTRDGLARGRISSVSLRGR